MSPLCRPSAGIGSPDFGHGEPMARTWLSITVELISGRGEDFWPRPGRIFVAARSHTFAALGDATNGAFARWDLSHLSQFMLADGTMIADTNPFFDAPEDTVDIHTAKLSTLELGDQFVCTFDFGDDWDHLCTVGPERVDPTEVYGVTPTRPVAYWGWGMLPDQHGRRWTDDHDEGPVPPDPEGQDLPAFFPPWRWRAEQP